MKYSVANSPAIAARRILERHVVRKFTPIDADRTSDADATPDLATAETPVPTTAVTDLSRALKTQDASMPQRVDEVTAGFLGLTDRAVLDQ